MKKIALFFILFFFVKSSFCQEIQIVKDTIEINLNRSLGPWLVHNDNFYCFFFKDNHPYGFEEEFYVFNRKGEVLKKQTPPRHVRIYYDLFVKNDTVFVLDYYNHDTYFINDNFDFVEAKRADDLIYQDSNYYVTSIDHGEWGGTTWFIDKQNKKEYELGISTPLINKIDNKYILTAENSIFEIKDPTRLKPCFAPRDYTTSFLTT